MTGSPLDGLGGEIKRGILRRLKTLFTGKIRCEFCGKDFPKREMKKDYLTRWKCQSPGCQNRG